MAMVAAGCGSPDEATTASSKSTPKSISKSSPPGSNLKISTGIHPDVVDVPPTRNDFTAQGSGQKAQMLALPSAALPADEDQEQAGGDAAPIDAASAPAH